MNKIGSSAVWNTFIQIEHVLEQRWISCGKKNSLSMFVTFWRLQFDGQAKKHIKAASGVERSLVPSRPSGRSTAAASWPDTDQSTTAPNLLLFFILNYNVSSCVHYVALENKVIIHYVPVYEVTVTQGLLPVPSRWRNDSLLACWCVQDGTFNMWNSGQIGQNTPQIKNGRLPVVFR